MTARLALTSYERVFALDTQMVFEARPLEQLPWQSITSGPVLLLILPQVSSEVDARKRDGRLGQRARNLNRQIEPSIETGEPVTIVEQPVRIDLAYVAAGLIEWPSLDDLERDNGDDRIVAQALNALVDDPLRIEIMSFDSRPRASARRHGLRAHKPDETWLLDPEPSPNDRRVSELEQRVRLLQSSEPRLAISIRTVTEQPLLKRRIEPVSEEQVETISRKVLAKNPRAATGGFYPLRLNENTQYDEEYDTYEAEIRVRDIPALHAGIARLYSAYVVEVVLENTGALAAEHVTVELRSGNARLHARPFFVDMVGPPPPSTRRDYIGLIPNVSRQLFRPDRTSFVEQNSDDRDVQVEFRCEDFRHGRTHILSLVLELTDRTEGAAHIEARVTAGNMRGDVTARMMPAVSEVSTAMGELVDIEELEICMAPPMRKLIVAALEENEDSVTYYRNDGSQR